MSDEQIQEKARELYAQLSGKISLPCTLHVSGTGNLPSYYPVTPLIAASVALAGIAVSQLVALKNDKHDTVTVDRRLASLWCKTSIRPEGWDIPPAWDSLAGDYATADGWIRLHTNAPVHRKVVETLLGKAENHEALALRVKMWKKAELEQAVVRAGGCAAQMFSPEEWQQHVQGKSLISEPLFQHSVSAKAALPQWELSPLQPLAGVKVLDLTRILAGPVATRFLAGLGAEVLRIDPFGWDEASQEADITLGKHCARLNLHNPQDRHRFEELLRDADVMVHGYRAGALHRLGYGSEKRRAIAPGLVDVCLNAYGWSGPWRERRGYDSLVQMSCGIAAQGMRLSGSHKPVPLPVQGLDHTTGYLMAAAVLHGLAQRMQTGQGCECRLSLARTACELMKNGASATACHEPLIESAEQDDFSSEPERTVWGNARRLLPPVHLENTTLRWRLPASPLGSAPASWR
ncbi:CoA transferase [Rahnella perminowiae]|uniref:CoA transferase n=1 Tax=Rahnella perminowiae TaxID=2816244 RepID=A0ABS6KXM5_9GAMM|nr:CoA transferase [Rahnella perminowiae]MBU9827771.1 CoA transferase [Rahnella perminowiae]MBU9834292.1 CoA transferase [Rahnella perminowiae]